MEEIAAWRDIIEQVLREYADFYFAANKQYYDENMVKVVFDRARDSYLVLDIGWQRYDRTHNVMLHLDIINGKIWIQEDNTEEGIATELEKQGIPKNKIVLAFKSPALRKYTEYAAA